MTHFLKKCFTVLGLVSSSFICNADELIQVKLLRPELAHDIVNKTVQACRKKGYQISAVVVDRSGIPQALLRDVYASQFTIDIAKQKANAVVLSGVSSAEFRRNRKDILNEMNHVEGILVLDGALPITAAGSLVGAVGVSGAPGGDIDEACAREGLQQVQERLDFSE